MGITLPFAGGRFVQTAESLAQADRANADGEIRFNVMQLTEIYEDLGNNNCVASIGALRVLPASKLILPGRLARNGRIANMIDSQAKTGMDENESFGIHANYGDRPV